MCNIFPENNLSESVKAKSHSLFAKMMLNILTHISR